jgi:ribonuclease HI
LVGTVKREAGTEIRFNNMPVECPNIQRRKFAFCPTLAGYDHNYLVVQCPSCTRFFAACCHHGSLGGDLTLPQGELCHYHQLVFIDGACSNNGRENARAGLGITFGEGEENSWSIPVDNMVDPDAVRTNQRAELLAAIEGLKKLEERYQISEIYKALGDPDDHYRPTMRREDEPRSTYIIVADSEYVVKGITEWLPTWRVRFY